MSFIARMGRRIAEAGGPGNALRHMFRIKKVPGGTLVGVDEFGNKYYEDKTAVYGELSEALRRGRETMCTLRTVAFHHCSDVMGWLI